MNNLLIILLIIVIALNIYFSTTIVQEGINVNKTAVQTYSEAVIANENDTNDVNSQNKKETNLNDNTENNLSYNTNKYDIEYHDSPEEIENDEDYGLGLQTTWVFDPKEQKVVLMQVPKMKTFPTYEIPGYYKYGYSTYVPDYTDSILLSSSKKKVNTNKA